MTDTDKVHVDLSGAPQTMLATLYGKALRATALNRVGARLVGSAPNLAGALTFALAAVREQVRPPLALVGQISRRPDGTRRVTAVAEVDAGGDLSNTATADTAETGPATDTLVIPIDQDPALGIVKSLTGGVYFTKAGDVLTYEYVVTNTGNITIPGPVTVTDNRTEVTCPPVTNIAPDASITCTAQDTVTSADFRAGTVTNTVHASAMVGREVVASSDVAVSAYRVIPPSAPPCGPRPRRSGRSSCRASRRWRPARSG